MRNDTYVLFTVHSQPIDHERNPPYVQQSEELATKIAKATQIDNYKLRIVHQVAKRTG